MTLDPVIACGDVGEECVVGDGFVDAVAVSTGVVGLKMATGVFSGVRAKMLGGIAESVADPIERGIEEVWAPTFVEIL